MFDLDRLSGDSDWIELEFLEREATPEPAMELGIHLHLAGLSLSDTVSNLERLGIDRHRTTVHRWVKKADLQPTSGCDPNRVVVDETVIQINDEQFGLYPAVDPETNRLPRVRLYPTRNQAVPLMFLAGLRGEHHVDDAMFLVDAAPWVQAALHRHGFRSQHETGGNRNAVKRVFREANRRTGQLSKTFSYVQPDTSESWFQALALYQNALI